MSQKIDWLISFCCFCWWKAPQKKTPSIQDLAKKNISAGLLPPPLHRKLLKVQEATLVKSCNTNRSIPVLSGSQKKTEAQGKNPSGQLSTRIVGTWSINRAERISDILKHRICYRSHSTTIVKSTIQNKRHWGNPMYNRKPTITIITRNPCRWLVETITNQVTKGKSVMKISMIAGAKPWITLGVACWNLHPSVALCWKELFLNGPLIH